MSADARPNKAGQIANGVDLTGVPHNLLVNPDGSLAVAGVGGVGSIVGDGATSKDGGAAWTTVRGVAGVPVTSADLSVATSVTDAPTSGQKLVITDLIISVDTAMSVSFSVESAPSTIIYGPFYLGANQTVNLVTRGKLKLGTADKKLQAISSVAGNVSILPLYYSEA